MGRILALILSVFAWLATVPALAAPKNPFHVEAEGAKLAPGGQGSLSVLLVVPEGYHVYRDMMEFKVEDPGGLSLGDAVFPGGEFKPDPASPGSTREQFDETVVIAVPVTAPQAAGDYVASFSLRYQGCKETLCYMPATEKVEATVSVVAGAGPASGDASGDAAGDAAGDVAGDAAGDAGASAAPVTVSAATGEAGQVAVSVHLSPGWHVNRDLFGLRLAEEGGDFSVGEDLSLPPGEPYEDPATGFKRTDLAEDFVVRAPVSGPDGQHSLDLLVSYQACKAELCLMPQDAAVTVSVQLGGAVAAAPVAAAPARGGGSGSGGAFSAARDQGLLALILLVFVSGIGVSLTPCVLPMVPITIGIIGARSAGSRIQALSLSATYVAGLALVYTSLGVAAGLTGMVFGAWMQSVAIVGAIAIFFFVMGLAMFGLFDVGVPASLQTRLSQYGGAGYGGAFVVGMVGALVAGPCSGPVLLSIIALIGKQGEVGLGALLMAIFSLGMGMIFLVAGVFSSTLLRPGAWMETVKKSFGLVMWVGALYFVSPHLSAPVLAGVAAAMLLSTAVFSWPSPTAEEDDGFWVARARRLYSLVGGLVGATLVVGLILSQGFLLPPLAIGGGAASGPVAAGPSIAWDSDEPAALARAAAEGKPVMVDFTADWCAACKELEHFTYTDAQVIDAASQMVTVMIDATNDKDPAVSALMKKYDVSGLPTVKFLRPDGTPIEDLTVIGFLPAPEFLPHMRSAIAASGGVAQEG